MQFLWGLKSKPFEIVEEWPNTLQTIQDLCMASDVKIIFMYWLWTLMVSKDQSVVFSGFNEKFQFTCHKFLKNC